MQRALEMVRPKVQAAAKPLLRVIDLQDILHEVGLELLRRYPVFQHNGERALRSWCFTLASSVVNTLKRYHGAGSRDPDLEVALTPDHLPHSQTPPGEAAFKELLEAAQAAARRFSREDQDVLKAYLVSKTRADAAKSLGMPERTYAKKLGHILALLGFRLRHFRDNDGPEQS